MHIYGPYKAKIIEKLKEIPALKHVAAWNGDIDELIKQLKIFPSAYVAFKNSDPIGEVDVITVEEKPVFSVLVFVKNLKGQDAISTVAEELVEDIMDKLAFKELMDGTLRAVPKSWAIIYSDETIMGYGIDFQTGFDRTFE